MVSEPWVFSYSGWSFFYLPSIGSRQHLWEHWVFKLYTEFFLLSSTISGSALQLLSFFKIQGSVDPSNHLPRSGSHYLQSDHRWSSLIVSDQKWPTADLHHQCSGISPPCSTANLHVYDNFLEIYRSSEVGHLLVFVEILFWSFIFITAVQTLGFGFDLPETTSGSCRNLLLTHLHPQICIQIHWWNPRAALHTDDRVVWVLLCTICALFTLLPLVTVLGTLFVIWSFIIVVIWLVNDLINCNLVHFWLLSSAITCSACDFL